MLKMHHLEQLNYSIEAVVLLIKTKTALILPVLPNADPIDKQQVIGQHKVVDFICHDRSVSVLRRQ